MKKFVLKYWPIIFILIIWFIFAHQYFLQGRVPFPSTYQVNNFAPWSTNSQFWGPVKNSAMPDIITQIYPWRHLAIEIWKSGQIPLWNPYTFSGNPLLANYQSAVLSPFNIILIIFSFVDGWSILVLLQPLLAGIFTYLYTRSLKISEKGSLISSISFMFCGFLTVWMGYATLGYAILFLPLALYFIEKYFLVGRKLYLIFFSLTFPLSFFSGHFQISTYFLFFVCAYGVYKFLSTRNMPKTLNLMLYVFFGLLLTMPQVLPSLELYFQSFRSSFFQTGFIPLQYTPTLLAPDFFGNPVTRNTWFGHYAEWNAYIGILPLMLAVYSILRIRSPQVYFLSIASILALTLATDNPISSFILSFKIPIVSTSAIGRVIVLYSFAFGVLAGFGFDQLNLDIKNSNNKKIYTWVGLFGIIFLILWIAILQKLFIPEKNILIARQNLILPSLIFLASGVAVVCTFLLGKYQYAKKMFLPVMGIILFLIISFDMLRFAIKWQPFDPKNLVFPDFPTTKAFSKISGVDRVFGNLGGEATIYYKLPSVEGYDALYSKKYGQLIGYIEKKEFKESSWSVVSFPKHADNTPEMINFLNIKYIVHKLADNDAPWTFPFWTYPDDQFKLIYKDNKYEFYQNNNVFPRAFLVGKYHIFQDPKKILETMFDKDIDLKNEIILEEDPGIEIKEGNLGSVETISYKENSLEFNVEANVASLMFLSDSWHSGWHAYIDGKETKIYRANYTFRAIEIPKGTHRAEFKFLPWSFKVGLYGFLVGLFGLLFFPKLKFFNLHRFTRKSKKIDNF